MNRDDIIAVAEGVGLHYYVNEMAGSYVERLERFAAVVASIEREACARVAEDWDTDSADPRDVAAAVRTRNT